MLTPVPTATDIVLENALSLSTVTVPLADALGKILREPLVADRDFPPFTRVSMDGIAIDFQAFAQGQRIFKVENVQAAGSPQLTLQDQQNCLEVMTGAVLPLGTDTVIRYEDVTIEHGQATINIETIRQGQNAHLQGSDRKVGDIIVKEGKVISSAEIATAASVGKYTLQVSQPLLAAIVSTGDELVEVKETPLPHQIRKSNVYAIQAALKSANVASQTFHLPDNPTTIKKNLERLIKDFDFIIMSGGVSKGKFDFIPQVLEELAVKKLFHRVQQKPGKPFWFGKAPNNTVVFALPGNPVSTFMCTQRYVLPWLRASRGLTPFNLPYAVLQQDFSFKPTLTYFLQVTTAFAKNGQLLATPVVGKGSGDLANLNDTDGFLELPVDRTVFKKGEAFRFLPFRPK